MSKQVGASIAYVFISVLFWNPTIKQVSNNFCFNSSSQIVESLMQTVNLLVTQLNRLYHFC